MRRSTYLLLLLFGPAVVAQDGNSKELADEGLKRLNVESGTVIYEISGEASGEAKLSWSHWGWMEMTTRNVTFELFGLNNSANSLDARNGDFVFQADLTTRKGKQAKERQTSDLLRYKNIEDTQKALFESKGGTLVGSDTLLDKEVKIWKFDSGNDLEIWEWNGIVLKSIRKLSSVTYTMTATHIDLNTTPTVTIPEDISWSLD